MFAGCGRYYPQPAGFHFVAIPLFLRGIREPTGFPGLRRWLCRSSSAYTNSPSSLQIVVFLLVLPFILADGGHFLFFYFTPALLHPCRLLSSSSCSPSSLRMEVIFLFFLGDKTDGGPRWLLSSFSNKFILPSCYCYCLSWWCC